MSLGSSVLGIVSLGIKCLGIFYLGIKIHVYQVVWEQSPWVSNVMGYIFLGIIILIPGSKSRVKRGFQKGITLGGRTSGSA